MNQPSICAAITAIIPTRNRGAVLARTLESLGCQDLQPGTIIIIDASDESFCPDRVLESAGLKSNIIVERATCAGAGPQRNQAFLKASTPFILFCDDDIVFEPGCIRELWDTLQADDKLGGVSAFITNQHYGSPGRVMTGLFSLMAGERRPSYAGRVIGPAINLLPALPESNARDVSVEWLNTTCTLYRTSSLPAPPFAVHFQGYSLMEDLALSAVVARKWRLANVATARIFHDSQPGDHKANLTQLNRMALINRHYVMMNILGKSALRDFGLLCLWELAQFSFCAIRSPKRLWEDLCGRALGMFDVLKARRQGARK